MMRTLLRLPLMGLLVVLVYLNARLYYRPQFAPVGNARVNTDLLTQLRHLEDEMHHGSWRLWFHALSALAAAVLLAALSGLRRKKSAR